MSQPPVVSVSLVKSKPLTVIKSEPPECEIVKVGVNNTPDIKDIDILWHPLCEDSIKTENILETIHSECLETQVLVKAENCPFIKAENLTENERTEYSENVNVSRGSSLNVVEVQDNLEKQLVLNFSEDLNGINRRGRKAKHPEQKKIAEYNNPVETTSSEKDKEEIKFIEAPIIPVKPHEYTSFATDEHVCNYCQRTLKKLKYVKEHIKKIHRKVTAIKQCPYCPFKSKWSVRDHIIQRHKETKDIQWFQCHLCEMKFKLKTHMTQHTRVHLTHEQMQDRLKLCLVCGKGFKTDSCLRRHMQFVHNKVEIKCEECQYTTTKSHLMKRHIESTHKNQETRYCCAKCAFTTGQYAKFKLHELSHKTKTEINETYFKFCCDKCHYKTYKRQHLDRHKLNHLKPEEIQYFHCSHCSYKSKQKENLKRHIFRHIKNGEIKHELETNTKKPEKRYFCDQCDYKTFTRQTLNRHKLNHLKPEEIPYFYCYHCSYKSKHKECLKYHIFKHFKNEDVPLHCYICNYMVLNKEAIVEHIKKHSKVQIKSEINEES